MTRGRLLVFLGGLLAAVGSVGWFILYAVSSFDSLNPGSRRLSWVVLAVFVFAGTTVATLGFRQLGSRGQLKSALWGVLTGLCGVIFPGLVAAVLVRR